MATLQKQRNPLTATTFPTKIATEQQSLMLVKRLLAISVSSITYLRGILPESAYGTRYLDDLCVKILKEDKKCPGSSQLVKWYVFCHFFPSSLLDFHFVEDPQTVTECYQFKFKYTDKGPSMDFRSQQSQSSITCADTKKASILLIRKIYILMQNLGPLPDNVCLTMKLFYYDEVTPPDYQPPGFKEGDCEGMAFEGEPMYLNVGEVPTPFHMLKVKVTTEKDRMEHVDKAILKEDVSLASLQDWHLQEDQHQKMDVRVVGFICMREGIHFMLCTICIAHPQNYQNSSIGRHSCFVYFAQEDFVPENKTGGQKDASRKLHPEGTHSTGSSSASK
uniref:HORMA domain-containing protein 1 n=1 Tax=Naja naja TaxID=35670 RepID=A0A8C6VM49_NAJNA